MGNRVITTFLLLASVLVMGVLVVATQQQAAYAQTWPPGSGEGVTITVECEPNENGVSTLTVSSEGIGATSFVYTVILVLTTDDSIEQGREGISDVRPAVFVGFILPATVRVHEFSPLDGEEPETHPPFFEEEVSCEVEEEPPVLTELFKNQGQCIEASEEANAGFTKQDCQEAFQNKSNRGE